MPIFTSEDEFKKYGDYALKLKKAVALVKGDSEKNFVFFKEFKFAEKKQPLVLVDVSLALKKTLAEFKPGPTGSGTVKLTESNELNFEAEKGKVNRATVRLALNHIGITNVYVPSGEIDISEKQEEGSPDEHESASQGSIESSLAADKVEATPSNTAPPKTPGNFALPPINKQMERKLATETQAYNERQPNKVTPAPLPPLNKPTGQNPVLASNRVEPPKTNMVPTSLPPLARATDQKPGGNALPGLPPLSKGLPPQNLKPEKETIQAQPVVLSSYLSSINGWKSAKKKAQEGVTALEGAIMSACDPDLREAVNARIRRLDVALDALKDSKDNLIGLIEKAGTETDPDHTAERHRAIANAATEKLEELQLNPLTSHLDKNPFGNFAIFDPLKEALNAIHGTFAS